MGNKTDERIKDQGRRKFFKMGGGLLAGSFAGRSLGNTEQDNKAEEENRIIRYKKLGRTGFKASDIGMGCTRFKHPNIARFA